MQDAYTIEAWWKARTRGKQSILTHEEEVHQKYGMAGALPGTAAALTRTLRERQKGLLRWHLTEKKLHGVFAKQTRRPAVDRRATHAWLQDGRLQAKTEALIVAAQDGVVHTGVYQTRILKRKDASSKCRNCESEETLGHILSKCRSYTSGRCTKTVMIGSFTT